MSLSRRSLAFVVPLFIALLSSTCAEGPTGSRRLVPKHANLSLATAFTPGAKAASALIHAAGLDVDRVQVVIALETETLRDTSIAFVSGQDQTLDLDVAVEPGTALKATVNYFAGTVLLYSGSTTVTAYAIGTPANQIPTATITVAAVAPGVNATRVTLAGPPPSPITAPVTLTAHAFLASGDEITGAIFGWSVDDATVATISGAGVLQPTTKSGTVNVTAITLSGVSATTAVTFYGPPAKIVTVSGDGQTAAVGTALAQPFVVQVQSATGAPVPNQTVTFGAANGSSVAPTTATTDANGRAQTVPTLGNTVGTYGFTATVATFNTTISATATVGAAATISVVSGDAQTDTIQKTLQNPLVVKVVDRFGNPNAGVTVNWARTAGAGAVSAATTTTDANGQTSVRYTLGAAAGAEAISASVAGVTAAATFSATALPKPASIALLSGDGQTGIIGKPLATQLAFKVLDTQGNPSPNVVVTFQATVGGGSLAPSQATSDATGVVKTTWTLGTIVGAQTMTASATGLTGSPVSVSATGITPPAVGLQFVQQPTQVAAGVAIAPAVTVRAIDADGNPVPSFAGAVSIAIEANPGQGVLGGTLTRTAVSGVATFNDLTVSNVGNGYTLAATSGVLTRVVSTAFTVLPPPVARIEWTNPQGGLWSVASNWNLNRVPAAADSVSIALAGTYTVNLDVDFAGTVVIVGNGAGGQQTLSLAPTHPLVTTGAVVVKSSGVLKLNNGVVGGSGTVTNEGAITTVSVGAIASPLANAPGATIRIAADGTNGGTGGITVSSGFTNHGTIDLSSANGGFPAALLVTGTLTNAADGVITSSLGNGGARSIDAELVNQGRIDVLGPLTLTHASGAATHRNTGTINVADADFTVASIAASSFTNDGTVTVGQGRAWRINGSTLTQTATSTLTGAGAIIVSGATAAFQGDVTLAAVQLSSTRATFDRPISTAATIFVLDGATVDGAATLTNAAGTTLQMKNSRINMPLVNQGTLLAIDADTISSAVTTAQGSTIRVFDDGFASQAQLVLLQNIVNNGTLELTSTSGGFDAIVNMASTGTPFTFTNAPTGTISALVGNGGNRILAAQLVNQGAVNVQQLLRIGATGVTHTNAGSFNLVGGDVLLLQTNGTGVFDNTGTMSLNAGRTFTVSGGTFNVQAGGTTSGTGTLALDNATVNLNGTFGFGGLKLTNNAIANLAADLNTTNIVLSLTNATVNGPGRVVNAQGQVMSMKASTIAATSGLTSFGTVNAIADNSVRGPLTLGNTSITNVFADGSTGSATLTVANAFTNDGAINLTSTVGGYSSALALQNGTFTNSASGTLTAAVGTGGPRTINAPVANLGSIVVSAPLTISQAGAAHTNSGVISASGADFAINYAAGTGSFINAGDVSIAAGHIVSITGGTFTQNGNISGGGGLALVNASTTFNNNNLPSALSISGGDATVANALTNGSSTMSFTNTTINANGGFTNVAGATLTMKQSTLNSPVTVSNQGTANFISDNAVNAAAFSTNSTSHIAVFADGSSGSASLNVSVGFTNNGIIDLTSTVGGYPSLLTVGSGDLVNAAGATINAAGGTGGARTITAALVNQGIVNVNAQLSLSKVGTTHTNSGTINVTANDLIITQGGTSPSFTNTGTIAIDPAHSVSVNGGTFTHSGGAINGGGVFITNGTVFNLNAPITLSGLFLTSGSTVTTNQALSTAGGMVLDISNSSLNGTGSLTNAATRIVTIEKNGSINIPFTNNGTLNAIGITSINNASFLTGATSAIEIFADGSTGNSQLTVPGFANNGTIDLTSTIGAYPAELKLSSGTLTNNAGAFINTLTGTGGARTITGSVTNNGTINVVDGGAGTLVITNNYTQNGTLNLELGGTATTAYDLLQTNTLSGTSVIAGTVNVKYINGFTAQIPDAFTILKYANGSTTANAIFNLPQDPAIWSKTAGATSFTITRQ